MYKIRQLPMKRKWVKTVNVALSALIKCHTQKDYNISHPIENLIYIQLREIFINVNINEKSLESYILLYDERHLHQGLTSLEGKENMSFRCCY